jgi:hypothetical protein
MVIKMFFNEWQVFAICPTLIGKMRVIKGVICNIQGEIEMHHIM